MLNYLQVRLGPRRAPRGREVVRRQADRDIQQIRRAGPPTRSGRELSRPLTVARPRGPATGDRASRHGDRTSLARRSRVAGPQGYSIKPEYAGVSYRGCPPEPDTWSGDA